VVASPLAPPARFAWRLDDDGVSSRLEFGDGLAEIDGVLVRGTAWLDPTGWAPEDHAYMQAEMLAATLAWLAGLQCPVVNRPSAALWYRDRASLLTWRRALRRCGLTTPEQVVTNDPAAARAFGRRLEGAGLAGAVYSPLTSDANYLVATPAAWQSLTDLQERAPVCVSEPHGATLPACVVGGRVVWDDGATPETLALEARLIRLASSTGLDFLEVVTAPLRSGPGVVMVEPMPVLEHFTPAARSRILDALADLLVPVGAGTEAIR